jgi:ATP synthase protein I
MNNSLNVMWRGALLVASIVAVISLITGSVLRGSSGFFGALLGSVTVVLFFSIHLIIAKITREWQPIVVMAAAFLSYFAKLALMATFLILVMHLTSPTSVDRPLFAGSSIAITIAWLGGEVRAFLTLRLHLPLPGEK